MWSAHFDDEMDELKMQSKERKRKNDDRNGAKIENTLNVIVENMAHFINQRHLQQIQSIKQLDICFALLLLY
uniref:Uncharacterized protein n=1 Tax=Onchocerca volvulus TaxID=6282 RepID=A0A2K6VF09_ONCVO